MDYLPRWAEKRRDSRLPYPGAVSAIVVALDYGGREPSGPVARYARGDDYHDVMVAGLRDLHAWIADRLGREVLGKAYVDTGPILERDLARRAGLGWFGKNTNLLNPKLGSFFFLGSLLVERELEPDPPFETEHCGTCTRCIEACPTQAIVAPGELDARRCVSYLTIEAKERFQSSSAQGSGTCSTGETSLSRSARGTCAFHARLRRIRRSSRASSWLARMRDSSRSICSPCRRRGSRRHSASRRLSERSCAA